jgi:hypothetical protein
MLIDASVGIGASLKMHCFCHLTSLDWLHTSHLPSLPFVIIPTKTNVTENHFESGLDLSRNML